MRSSLTRVSGLAVLLAINACTSPQMAAPVVEKTAVPAAEPELVIEQDQGYSSDGVQVQPLEESDWSTQPIAEDQVEETETASNVEESIEPVNPAVIALLNAANTHTRAGNHDSAAASLERAVKIEPKNPGVWHRLAKVRLDQGLYTQAENLATRSNSLAGQDRALMADNWFLIADARLRMGDTAGANAAELRAQEFLKLKS